MRRLAMWLLLTAACNRPVGGEEGSASATVPASAPGSTSALVEERSGVGGVEKGDSATPTLSGEKSFDIRPRDLSGIGEGAGIIRPPNDSRIAITAAIRMGASSVNGPLHPRLVQRIVGGHLNELRKCHEAALAKAPALSGRVLTTFTIFADGKTGEAKTTGDIDDKGMLACVQKRFAAFEFPAPEKGLVKVSYPLLFDPPPYAFMIGEAFSINAREADIAKALEAADYKVTGSETPAQDTSVARFKAEKAGVTFSLTLDPAASLHLDFYRKLKREGVSLEDGSWGLFVESSDKVSSQALIDAIHKKLESK